MTLKPLFALGLIAVLAGCGSPPPQEGPVRIASASEVGQCKYIIDINNKVAMTGGTIGAKAVAYGRRTMMMQAASAGANTIVFGTVPGDLGGTGLTATGYRC